MEEVAGKCSGARTVYSLQISVPCLCHLGEKGAVRAQNGGTRAIPDPFPLGQDVLPVVWEIVREESDVTLQHGFHAELADVQDESASQFCFAFNKLL